jgi:hypothetical protein
MSIPATELMPDDLIYAMNYGPSKRLVRSQAEGDDLPQLLALLVSYDLDLACVLDSGHEGTAGMVYELQTMLLRVLLRQPSGIESPVTQRVCASTPGHVQQHWGMHTDSAAVHECEVM